MRAAQSTAMNRLIKASNKVEVDHKAAETLKVMRADFMYALEHDIKPVCVQIVPVFKLFDELKIVSGFRHCSRNFRSYFG